MQLYLWTAATHGPRDGATAAGRHQREGGTRRIHSTASSRLQQHRPFLLERSGFRSKFRKPYCTEISLMFQPAGKLMACRPMAQIARAASDARGVFVRRTDQLPRARHVCGDSMTPSSPLAEAFSSGSHLGSRGRAAPQPSVDTYSPPAGSSPAHGR